MRAISIAKDYFVNMCERKPPRLIEDEEVIEGKTVLITGATSGIGKAAMVEFVKRGAVVVIACRNTGKARKVIEEVNKLYPEGKMLLVELDLGDLSSIRKCAEEIRSKCENIHIFINNAGCLYVARPITTTKDGFEMHMGTNYLGHFLLTNLLLDIVKAPVPTRIVFVGSTLHLIAELDLEDMMLTKRGYFGVRNYGPYANSKLAMLYFATELAKRLKDSGVHVYTLCPGYVKSDAFRNESFVSSMMTKTALSIGGTAPEKAVQVLMYCSTSKSIAEDSGKMYHFNRSWEKVNKNIENFDQSTLTQLWYLSEKLTSTTGW